MDFSDIFYFFLLGSGRESPRRWEWGRDDVLFKIPGGGVSQAGGGGGGRGREVFAGNWGGGRGLNILFSGPKFPPSTSILPLL